MNEYTPRYETDREGFSERHAYCPKIFAKVHFSIQMSKKIEKMQVFLCFFAKKFGQFRKKQ